jgi:hypothetical protein
MTRANALSAPRQESGLEQNLLERTARTAIERKAARTLTDIEWIAMRARLLEFAAVLRNWIRDERPSAR